MDKVFVRHLKEDGKTVFYDILTGKVSTFDGIVCSSLESYIITKEMLNNFVKLRLSGVSGLKIDEYIVDFKMSLATDKIPEGIFILSIPTIDVHHQREFNDLALPKSLRVLGSSVFINSKFSGDVVLGEFVSFIGINCFRKVSGNNLILNCNRVSFGENCFASAHFNTIRGLGSVSSLSTGCFSNTIGLGDVVLSKCTSIGTGAFSCSDIRSIDLVCVRKIKLGVFANCCTLEEATISESCAFDILPSSTFYNCKSLRKLTVNNHHLIALDYQSLQGVCSLNTLDLRNSKVRVFKEECFQDDYDNSFLEVVYLPDYSKDELDKADFTGLVQLGDSVVVHCNKETKSILRKKHMLCLEYEDSYNSWEI